MFINFIKNSLWIIILIRIIRQITTFHIALVAGTIALSYFLYIEFYPPAYEPVETLSLIRTSEHIVLSNPNDKNPGSFAMLIASVRDNSNQKKTLKIYGHGNPDINMSLIDIHSSTMQRLKVKNPALYQALLAHAHGDEQISVGNHTLYNILASLYNLNEYDTVLLNICFMGRTNIPAEMAQETGKTILATPDYVVWGTKGSQKSLNVVTMGSSLVGWSNTLVLQTLKPELEGYYVFH